MTAQFESYCKCTPELEPLTMTEKQWRAKKSYYNSIGVVGVSPGMKCFVNLKAWGSEFYWSIGLQVGVEYVVECCYRKWTTQKKLKMDLYCPFFDQSFDWNASAVRLYGLTLELKNDVILVDDNLSQLFPKLLE
jgi:hypothetical protein